MNTSSDANNVSKASPTKQSKTSSLALGRETIFAGDLTNDFISPNPPQKKRDLDQIQKIAGSSLQVLESKPQNEVVKPRPLVTIIRNTYETKIGNQTKIRCRSPVLNFSTESAGFQEESKEKRKVYKEKVGFEANSETKGPEVPLAKSQRVERIMDSGGMKGSLTSKEEPAKNEDPGIHYRALVKASRENRANNLNTPYKFKHSIENKQAFYVN